ncbi:hypothetical protein pb186bvf_004333 [Paramecium bursaria]
MANKTQSKTDELIEYKNQIKELMKEVNSKDELIKQYEAQNQAADQKIVALISIHSDKVRNLMNSIQVLKKECAQLKKIDQGNKRSELIRTLNKEIADQEVVISALKELINDEDRCTRAIVKKLSEGPPQVRAKTREELKIDIAKLKADLEKAKKDLQIKRDQDQQLDNMSTASDISKLEKQKEQSELEKYRNDALKNIEELESLQKQLRDKDGEIERISQELNKVQHKTSDLNILMNLLLQKTQKLETKDLNQEYNQIEKEAESDNYKIFAMAKMAELNTKNSTYQLKIVELTNKIEQFENNVQQLQQKMSVLEDSINAKNAQKQKDDLKIQQLSKQIIDLEAEKAILLEEKQKLETESKATIDKLQIDIDRQLELLDNFQRQIEDQKMLLEDKQLNEQQIKLQDQRAKTAQQREYEKSINRNIQKVGIQDTGNKQLQDKIKLQQRKFEDAIHMMHQNFMDMDKSLSEVSSNINGMGLQEEQLQNLDDIDSNISQFQKQDEDPFDLGSHINQAIDQDDIDSNVSSLAPKKSGNKFTKQQSQNSQDNQSINSSIKSIISNPQAQQFSQVMLHLR